MKLATLCYIENDGKILMIHRVKKQNDVHEGKWNGLGGKFEAWETPEECAIREVKEESGFLMKNPTLKGLLTFPEFSKGEDWYVFVFKCTEIEGELIEPVEGNLEWIANEKLLELNLWEGDRYFIPWLERTGFFSAKFVYKDGKLLEHSVIFYE
ncbi:MAG: NUDIX domain-containing protein [Candidatus Hodarchaeota archaeon]